MPGEDSSGTCHEFEDGRAERKATVLTGETTWNEADWNVWADSTLGGCTTHTKAASALSLSTEFLDAVKIYTTDNYNLRINDLQKGSATISIFNVLGKNIMNTSFEASSVKNIALPNLASGVYIVKLQTEDGSLNKKIILE